MQTFTDTQGREWTVAVTFSTLRRVRDSLGFDLSKVLDGGDETQRLTDPVTLIDTLFVVVKPQADALGVTDEQFGESLDGESAEHAAEALAQAVIGFFPPARRELYQRAKNAGDRMTREITSRALESLSKLESPSTSSSASTDSPASSDSPPATSTT